MRNARRTVTVVVLTTSLLVLTVLAAASQAVLRSYLVGQIVEALHQERTVLTQVAAGPGTGTEEADSATEKAEEALDHLFDRF
ncbi:hypothetical protein [Actinomyces wuliandei]|uniref:hypothetical protein n=1 Tax=Actinomyces wuliandei TaxID=2057743 RepID=UPI000FD82B21|nr:hypothetical protein [Actinomyces wuliandei]